MEKLTRIFENRDNTEVFNSTNNEIFHNCVNYGTDDLNLYRARPEMESTSNKISPNESTLYASTQYLEKQSDSLTNNKRNVSPERITSSKYEHPMLQDHSKDCRDKECEMNLSSKRKCDPENDVILDAKKKSSEDKKCVTLRKNIRDVMDENFLDTNTLAAQREESERLARVQEQQKLLREYQRQKVSHRQMKNRDRILSLLQTDNSLPASPKESYLHSSLDANIYSKTNLSTVNAYFVNGVAQEVSLDETSYSKGKEVEEKNLTVSIDSYVRTNSLPDISTPEHIKSDVDEIVTIVDSSSENDCILLSDDPDDEGEVEDDPQNSGLHVKDIYNVADTNGNVVVNVGHPKAEPDIFIAPQIARAIKPHQIGGVRFLYDNIIESTSRFNNSTGFGCILAHSMGLGKTLQVICFCDIFLRHTDSKTVLCVMPINTIQNWAAEFNIWTPKESENHKIIRPRNFNVYVLNDQQKTLSARSKIIFQWAEEGGVLLMGYELFRLLALKLVSPKKKKNKSNKIDVTENKSHAKLVEKIHMALVTPGPDLVICDEGHRIKNSHAGISVALKQIRTRRRIVLTGYPLQNNLLEYWCMVDFVRPNYLGTKTEFSNMFERPIQNGQCIDSTPEDIKLMRYRAHVLHSLLVGFVQRRSHVVLQNSLPNKLEYVLLTKMTSFQRKLYDTFMNDVVRTKIVPNPLKAFAVCCKIWNHPDVLYNFLKKKENDLDFDIDESESSDRNSTVKNKNKNLRQVDMPLQTSGGNLTRGLEKKYECSKIASTEGNFYINEPYAQICSSNLYQTTDIESTFIQGITVSDFWHDTSAPVDYGSTTPTNVLPYLAPAILSQSDQEIQIIENKSSQIVDLDTKEIKTMETNIDFAGAKKYVDIPSKILYSEASNGINREEKGSDLSAKFEKESKNKSDEGIPYEWAVELMKDYEPDSIENSPKIKLLFCIVNESYKLGDRILLFSQSLLTLNLIENYLQKSRLPGTNCCWAKNMTYFRLDGSTTSLEREKFVNEFNTNKNIHLFLISTRAGSLGINLVGANRVIVFDASWNPCHDTQAVYRIYRYGQMKPCFVYRIVMDNCLEKKIYDRQVKKQGMSNRVVDECNPDPYLSMKDVTNLCFDYEENNKTEFEGPVDGYDDIVMQRILDLHRNILSKEPFHHESLLIDRKEKKLSQAEKRLAQRSYEMEKKATAKQTFFFANNKFPSKYSGLAPIRPVPSLKNFQTLKLKSPTVRWIPAEVWQRQGMSAQEMVLPLDVVIPTHSNDKTNIVLKAGQKVMVLKSPKGIYMQLENGKIIAIRTSNNSQKVKDKIEHIEITSDSEAPRENANTSKKKDSEVFISHHKDSSLRNTGEKNTNCSENAYSKDIDINDDVIIISDSLKKPTAHYSKGTMASKEHVLNCEPENSVFTNRKIKNTILKTTVTTENSLRSATCRSSLMSSSSLSKSSPNTLNQKIPKNKYHQFYHSAQTPSEKTCSLEAPVQSLRPPNMQQRSSENHRGVYPQNTQKDENVQSNNDSKNCYLPGYTSGSCSPNQENGKVSENKLPTYKDQREHIQKDNNVNDLRLGSSSRSVDHTEVLPNSTIGDYTHIRERNNSEYEASCLNSNTYILKQGALYNKEVGYQNSNFDHSEANLNKEKDYSFNRVHDESMSNRNSFGQQMLLNFSGTNSYTNRADNIPNQYFDTTSINPVYHCQTHEYPYASQYHPHYSRSDYMSPQQHQMPHRFYMRWSPMSDNNVTEFEQQNLVPNHTQYPSQPHQWQRK